MIDCSHEGFHTGQGRYEQQTAQLRYVVVCDQCQAELREVHREDYAPRFDPRGNDAFLREAA
jgi:hypothetical protein